MQNADLLISAEFVRSILTYEPDTGIMRWRSGPHAGEEAGGLSEEGYRRVRICLFGKRINFRVHRLAWLHFYGRHAGPKLDHRDRLRSNNRIKNLREATDSENAMNRELSTRNTSGHKGVCWRAREQKWGCQIMAQGRMHYLGYYDDFDLACLIYDAKAAEIHGEFSASV